MNEHMLICMVGLPRSGKTTWAKRQGFPIVNPDSIRFALHGQRYEARAEPFVWAIAKVMVHALFLAGNSTVILDATNTTRKRRDAWQSDWWATRFVHINTAETICVERAIEDIDEEIIPVIERMLEGFEPLGEDEVVYCSSINGAAL